MKLKKVYILISLLLFSHIISIESTKSKQLFDMISNDKKEKQEITQNQPEKRMNSLFDSSDDNEKESEPTIFNQLSEKETSKSNIKNSLFAEDSKDDKENLNQDNSNKIAPTKTNENENKPHIANNSKSSSIEAAGIVATHDAKPHENINNPNKDTPVHSESIDSASASNKNKSLEESDPNKNFKSQLKSLIQTNEKLVKKMRKHHLVEKKKNATHKKMISFIQKYENHFKNLKNSKDITTEIISKKDEEIKKLLKNTQTVYGNLQNKLERVNNQMNQIKNQEKQYHDNNIQSEPQFDSVVVDEKLMVDGVANINKIKAKEIDLGNLKIGANHITIGKDQNLNITFGRETLSVGELFHNMKALRRFLELCGENFECLRKEEELHERQFAQQREILESLKNLKMETDQILNRRRLR
jgi:hypothetical protein